MRRCLANFGNDLMKFSFADCFVFLSGLKDNSIRPNGHRASIADASSPFVPYTTIDGSGLALLKDMRLCLVQVTVSHALDDK